MKKQICFFTAALWERKSSMSIIQAMPNAQFATIVFNGLTRSAEEINSLKEQISMVFASDQVLFLERSDIDYLSVDAFTAFQDRLRDAIYSFRLMNSNNYYQLVFYEECLQIDTNRIHSLFRFYKRACNWLGLDHIIGTLFILKDGKNDENAKTAIDDVVDLYHSETNNTIQLSILDARPLSVIEPAIRASIRYSHILANNTQLRSAIYQIEQDARSEASGESLLLSLAMTQLDVDAVQKIDDEMKKWIDMMQQSGLPKDDLNVIIKSFVERERRYFSTIAFPIDSLPIAKEAVGKSVLSKRKNEIESALNELAYSVKRAMLEGLLDHIKCHIDDQIPDVINKLIEIVPINEWNSFRQWAKALGETYQNTSWRSSVSISLQPCRTADFLREEIANQVESAKKAMLEIVYGYVCFQVAEKILSDDLEDVFAQKKQLATHELQRLTNKKALIGSYTTPGDYLIHAKDETDKMQAPPIGSFVGLDYFLMISNQIAVQWKQYGYDKYYSGNVYNCGTLDDQEFEMLQFKLYTKKGYMAARPFMFPLSEMV